MRYAFLDESGNTAPFQPSECFLVVAVITATPSVARAIALHLKRLKKTIRSGPRDELKASEATPKQRIKLLKAVADEDIAIVAVVLNKEMARNIPEDQEDWYRQMVSMATGHCARHWTPLRLVLHKRYTNIRLRCRLEKEIRDRLGTRQGDVAIEQLGSRARPELQVVDYVAWAIRRKYAVGEWQYYDIIKSRIIVEDVIEAN